MLLPMVANTTSEITRKVADSFVDNISLSLVVTFLMFELFPSLPSEPQPAPKLVLPAAEVDIRAWVLTALTDSYLVAYFSFEWTNVHTPLYIAIYAYGANLVIVNVIGASLVLRSENIFNALKMLLLAAFVVAGFSLPWNGPCSAPRTL